MVRAACVLFALLLFEAQAQQVAENSCPEGSEFCDREEEEVDKSILLQAAKSVMLREDDSSETEIHTHEEETTEAKQRLKAVKEEIKAAREEELKAAKKAAKEEIKAYEELKAAKEEEPDLGMFETAATAKCDRTCKRCVKSISDCILTGGSREEVIKNVKNVCTSSPHFSEATWCGRVARDAGAVVDGEQTIEGLCKFFVKKLMALTLDRMF